MDSTHLKRFHLVDRLLGMWRGGFFKTCVPLRRPELVKDGTAAEFLHHCELVEHSGRSIPKESSLASEHFDKGATEPPNVRRKSSFPRDDGFWSTGAVAEYFGQ